MFLLVVIPFTLAYIITARVLRESDSYLRVAVTFALGLTLFLFSVNILFHFFALKVSVYLTLALMGILSIGLLRVEPVQPSRMRVGRLEAVVVTVLAMTAFCWALFWQMRYVDDDIYPHLPLMALYLRDIFPPMNPLYPDMPLRGHYGRDLTISALSVLFDGRFLHVQYVVTALNQSATVFLTYFASRRFLGSRRQALLAVLLLFLGMRSLLEVFGNNNSFVYLFLFLNAYLYLVALVQRSLGPKIVSFASLATYAIVYETHYGILLVVFSLSCLILTFARPRHQPRYVLIAALILGASLVVALVQGGTLSDLGRRHVLSSPQGQGALKDLAQINQEVTIRFPKPHLNVTSFDGTEYPLISLRLLREAGYFVVFLPAVAIVMLLTRRIWGLFVTGMAIVALAIPTTVDFGTHNAESYRFLFFGGIAAAMSLGITVGVGLDRLEEHGRLSFRIRVVVLCLLLLACSGSIFRTAGNLAHVARRPQEYFWYAEEWACQGMYHRVCDPMDITTAIKIRPLIRSGNVIMTNVSTGNPADPLLRTAHSVIAAFAGAFVGGHGILISQDRLFKMGREYTEPEGFRAIAFWNTGEPELLDDLHVDYLLIDPDKTLPSVLQKLKRDTRFKLVHRETDVWRGEREVYRVSTKTPASPLQTPADLTLERIEIPTSVQRASFHPLSLVVATRDSAFTGSLRLGYRAFYKDLLVNATDEIRHVVHFTRTGRGTWVGHLFFVAPYESGVYTVDVYSADTGKPLLRRDGSPAAFEVAVSD